MPVLLGKWGYYYPYEDENGNKKGLKILDWVYSYYYHPGYLTDKLIEQMLAGKTVTFEAKSYGKMKTVTARVIPYVTKGGQNTRIIDFSSEDKNTVSLDDDIAKINDNSDSILEACGFDKFEKVKRYTVAQAIKALKLSRSYSFEVDTYDFGVRTFIFHKVIIKLYKDQNVVGTCNLFNMADMFKRKQTQLKESEFNDYYAKYKNLMAEYHKVTESLFSWFTDLHIPALRSVTIGYDKEDKLGQYVVAYDKCKEIINNITIPTKKFDTIPYGFNYDIFTDSPTRVMAVEHLVTLENYKDEDIEEKYKGTVLNFISSYLAKCELTYFKAKILYQIQTEGLEAAVADVNIDNALDIGKFRSAKKALNKLNKSGKVSDYEVACFIMKMYDGEGLPKEEKKTKILNMLKIYYCFYNFPEKERKSIAKFIATHNMKEYYERISQFDDVIETLLDYSKDMSFVRQLASNAVSAGKTDILKKDKTKYFTKDCRVSKDYLMYKPTVILERLRDEVMPMYNASDTAAIIFNIILNSDETFTFEFYTYVDDEVGENFDGRRLQYITKLYNMRYPNERIGFTFNNN